MDLITRAINVTDNRHISNYMQLSKYLLVRFKETRLSPSDFQRSEVDTFAIR